MPPVVMAVVFVILTLCVAAPVAAQATHDTTVTREPVSGENFPRCGLSTELSGFSLVVVRRGRNAAGGTMTGGTIVTHMTGVDENGVHYVYHEAGHSVDQRMFAGDGLRFMEHGAINFGTSISGPNNNHVEHFDFHHTVVGSTNEGCPAVVVVVLPSAPRLGSTLLAPAQASG